MVAVVQILTSGATWTWPVGVSSAYVEIIGGGGNGASQTGVSAQRRNGGGGGGYSAGTVTGTPGTSEPIAFGAQTYFRSATTIMARSGANAGGSNGGQAAGGAVGVGTVKFAGGSGFGQTSGGGGGGGGAAGPNGAGANAGTGAASTGFGGAGADGGSAPSGTTGGNGFSGTGGGAGGNPPTAGTAGGGGGGVTAGGSSPGGAGGQETLWTDSGSDATAGPCGGGGGALAGTGGSAAYGGGGGGGSTGGAGGAPVIVITYNTGTGTSGSAAMTLGMSDAGIGSVGDGGNAAMTLSMSMSGSGSSGAPAGSQLPIRSGVSFPAYGYQATYSVNAGAIDPNYPIQNLASLASILTVASWSAVGAVAFTGVLPAADPVQFIGLLHHNGDVNSTMRIRLYSDAGSTALVYDSGANTLFPAGSQPSARYLQNAPVLLANPVSVRSFRIDLAGNANAWQVGGVELAGFWEWDDVAVPREFGVVNKDKVYAQPLDVDHVTQNWSPRSIKGQRNVVMQTENDTTALDFLREKMMVRPFVWLWSYGDPTTYERQVIVVRNNTLPLPTTSGAPTGTFQFDFIEHMR